MHAGVHASPGHHRTDGVLAIFMFWAQAHVTPLVFQYNCQLLYAINSSVLS